MWVYSLNGCISTRKPAFPTFVLCNRLSVVVFVYLMLPARCVSGVPPVQREVEGLCWLQREDPGPLHAAGAGQVLARGLPEVCLLWLPPGPGGLHPLHPGKPHPVPQRLPEVTVTHLSAGGSEPRQGGAWLGTSDRGKCRVSIIGFGWPWILQGAERKGTDW